MNIKQKNKYLKKTLCIVLVSFMFPFLSAGNSKKILINEFLASNGTGIVDEDGDYSDWIELYNATNEVVDLTNWSLTDNADRLTKWKLPSVSIGAGEFLLVFASSKNRTGSELHTNFSLSKDGEYLALVESDGVSISDEYAPVFPPQKTDVSYGYYLGETVFFNTPTPGVENTLEGQALSPVFSVTRGFYDAPFNVTLTTSDPETKIYYTTNGTRPTASSTPYSSPIKISRTTPLSAVGIKGDAVSLVVTNSYFFINDIVNQSATPRGYPDRWGVLGSDVNYAKYAVGERAPAHYAMSTEVCNDPAYKQYIEDAFLAIPSLSIVTNSGYLFSDANDANEGGIYIHTGVRTGDGWERPVSLEYFEPETERQFQINCGLKIHGAASRQPEKSGKHSFRAHFRKTYGAGKLHFDLFEDETAVTKFDHLVLRAGFGYSWLHWMSGDRLHSQYVIDAFAKKTQLNMGHKSAHSRFAHLFINGLYWGLYDITERISDNFMEAYFGGEDVDYDVFSHNGLVAGTRTAFNNMMNLAQAGNFDELLSENLLAMENYIDYLLINFYIGNSDWGNNNWYTARNWVRQDDGFRFFIWDTENCFFTGSDYNLINGGRFKGSYLWQILFGADSNSTEGGLLQNEEFKLLFADRVQKHFFNNGVLTPEKTAELYNELSNSIYLPIILESARWGSYRRDVLPGDGASPLYTRDEHWTPKKEYLLEKYFPKRTAIVYEQLREFGLVPSIDAPVFSSLGGEIDEPLELSMNAATGAIYYTIDGTDPREKGSGNVAASAKQYKNTPLTVNDSATIKARAKARNTWSALSEVRFTSNSANGEALMLSDETVHVSYQQGGLFVQLPKNGDVQLAVYSIDGKYIRNVNTYLTLGNNRIELPEIPTGVYVYRITMEDKTHSGKFIK